MVGSGTAVVTSFSNVNCTSILKLNQKLETVFQKKVILDFLKPSRVLAAFEQKKGKQNTFQYFTRFPNLFTFYPDLKL